MIKASAITTKMVVVSFIAIISNTDTITTQAIKLLYSNLLHRESNSKKNFALQMLGTAGPLGRPLKYAAAGNSCVVIAKYVDICHLNRSCLFMCVELTTPR